MSLTHTRLAYTAGGWSSKRLGAQRSPWVESVVRGVGPWAARHVSPDGAWPCAGLADVVALLAQGYA